MIKTIENIPYVTVFSDNHFRLFWKEKPDFNYGFYTLQNANIEIVDNVLTLNGEEVLFNTILCGEYIDMENIKPEDEPYNDSKIKYGYLTFKDRLKKIKKPYIDITYRLKRTNTRKITTNVWTISEIVDNEK